MLIQDIRHTFRGWRRTPLLAITAILTLSLGIGANAAVFSVVHAVLFRPLPYPAPERLVEVFEFNPTTNSAFRVSALNYLSWSTRTKTFVALAAFQSTGFNVTGDADAERVAGASVTASLFPVLGVTPVAGRRLRAEDEMRGSARVALISASFWQGRYGGDPGIIGKTITLNGERHEIIGVVPETFREVGRSRISAVADPQVFVPLTIDPARENRRNHVLRVVGRLLPHASIEQARDEMTAIAAAMEREFPASNQGWGVRLERVHDSMLAEGVRTSLLTLLGAVALVMLIACANVSNLVLAKAIGRTRELALRTALGAKQGRLVRQLLTESFCLAVVSGIIGVCVAIATVQALRSLLPPTLPRINEVRIDVVVLAFGLFISLCSGILFGIFPALQVRRINPLAALVQGGRGFAGSSRSVVRQGLVAAQMALATTLLVGAVLLLQSFVRLQHVPLGFEPQGVLTARIGLPRTAYPDATRIMMFQQRLIQSLEDNPEVHASALATSAPFAPGVRRSFGVGSRTTSAATSPPTVAEHTVSDNYFRTLAIPIVAGRAFDERDREGSPPVVIVSQATAKQLWSDSNPIGQQLERDGVLHEVVGVAGDVRGDDAAGALGGGLDLQPRPAIYISATQFPQATMTVLLRTTREPAALVPALRAVIREIDPTLPLYQARTLSDWLADTAAHPRLTTTLAGVFAVIALLLAAIGIYGVVAYTVGQRTPEIGLRIAAGATRGQIMALILRGGMKSVVIGMTLGLTAAFLLNRVLASLLFEVQAHDPFAFASTAILLPTVALVACYLPAHRAARVDPLVALRYE